MPGRVQETTRRAEMNEFSVKYICKSCTTPCVLEIAITSIEPKECPYGEKEVKWINIEDAK